MEGMELVWGVGLFAAAFLLFVIEMFVPSAGILGITAAICAIAGCVAFFMYSPMIGMLSAVFLIIAAPTAAYAAFKYYPHTPIGRRMILGNTAPGEDDESAQRRAYEKAETQAREKQIVGAEGVTVTDLHPVGVVRIEGERIQALAETGIIEADTPIRVIAVVGSEVRVRPIT